MSQPMSLDDLIGLFVDAVNYAAHRDQATITLTLDEADATADALLAYRAAMRVEG